MKLLTYQLKFYLSPEFYKKVSPGFARDVEKALSKEGTIYKTKEEFEAAKKPMEFL